jgi:tyrosine-protein kinase Etk/Wzc
LQGSIQYESQLSALQLQETSLLQRFTPQNPQIIALEQQRAQLMARKADFENRFKALPVNEANAVSLQRDVTVKQDIYVLLLNKVQELSLTRAGTVGNVRLLDPALRPSIPVKPKKTLIVSASVLMGLILGGLFVFARKRLMTGVEDPDLIERNLQLPVLGMVAMNSTQARWDQESKRRDAQTARPILARALPRDPSVEALRSFRTAMQFSLLEAPNNIISFSGPTPGTGKSFVSINLATLLAESGQRVLLIDADMRRGHLNEYFAKPRSPGLSEILSGKAAPASVINTTEVPGLFTIWTGAIPDSPSELLMSSNARAIFDGYGRDFDVVIIDTPPVLAVTDAAIIAAFEGTSYLVLRSGLHSEREMSAAVRKMTQTGGRLAGAVFNAVPSRVAKSGKYGSGNYHYIYDYDTDKS